MFVLKIISLFFFCILAGCGNSVSQLENGNRNHLKEKLELSLKMIRKGCYGRCPIYDLTIQPDGKVLFEGRFWTKIRGKATDKITEKQFEKLIDEIEKANFFSFDDAYNYDSNNCPVDVTDHATVILYIKLNGKEKTIDHYLGCWEDDKEGTSQGNSDKIPVSEEDLTKNVFPQQLYQLENKIDEIVGTKRWVGEQK